MLAGALVFGGFATVWAAPESVGKTVDGATQAPAETQ